MRITLKIFHIFLSMMFFWAIYLNMMMFFKKSVGTDLTFIFDLNISFP